MSNEISAVNATVAFHCRACMIYFTVDYISLKAKEPSESMAHTLFCPRCGHDFVVPKKAEIPNAYGE